MPRHEFDLVHLSRRLFNGGTSNGGCWEWAGYLNPRSGYGQISLNKAEQAKLGLPRVVTVPRLACTLLWGPANGRVVLHSCDNKACYKPSHLRWGTYAENNREAWDRLKKTGERHHMARLTDAEVTEVVRRARSGESPYKLAGQYGVDWSVIYRWLRGEGRGRRAA